MKYSIVMAYRNRKRLLINTLNTLKHSEVKDIEVVITDDGSSDGERLEGLTYPFPIKILRIEPKDRWYCNPCIPFNMAMRAAVGEIVVIQNPEVLHTCDILKDIETRLTDEMYLTYGVYSLSGEKTALLSGLNYDTKQVFTDILNTVKPFNPRGSVRVDGWFNHSIHRPAGFHFLAVLTNANLKQIGYFDERFAKGVDREDLEFINRMKRNLKLTFVDDKVALHQHHALIAYDYPNLDELRERNRLLFNSL